jgi:hypothetical protein
VRAAFMRGTATVVGRVVAVGLGPIIISVLVSMFLRLNEKTISLCGMFLMQNICSMDTVTL